MASVFGDVQMGKGVNAAGGGPPWFQVDKENGKTGEGGEYVLKLVAGKNGSSGDHGPYCAFEVEVEQAKANVVGHTPAIPGQIRTMQFMKKFKSTPANLKNILLAIGFTLEEIEADDGKAGGALVDMLTSNYADGPLSQLAKAGVPVRIRASFSPTETGSKKWILKSFFQEVPGETLKDCLAKKKAAAPAA